MYQSINYSNSEKQSINLGGLYFAYAGPEGVPSAWQEWLQQLLQSALLATPFDLAEVWAVALRYALHGLGKRDSPHFGALLNLIAEPLPQGAPRSEGSHFGRAAIHV
jgi:hypothetical protein